MLKTGKIMDFPHKLSAPKIYGRDARKKNKAGGRGMKKNTSGLFTPHNNPSGLSLENAGSKTA